MAWLFDGWLAGPQSICCIDENRQKVPKHFGNSPILVERQYTHLLAGLLQHFVCSIPPRSYVREKISACLHCIMYKTSNLDAILKWIQCIEPTCVYWPQNFTTGGGRLTRTSE